jgi:alpha-tubulin suppressor-like RCC1 family protein
VLPWSIVRGRMVAICLALLGGAASLPYVACELAFPTHLADAGAGCTDGPDTLSDPLNCGACGNVCEEDAGCFRGVCGGMQVTQISAGLHACALVKAQVVFCWGSNLFGETGSAPATMTCGTTPCLPTPTEVAGVDHVVEVRAGYYSTCALEENGSVWCWGQNQAGQLGSATSTGTCGAPCDVVPVQVALPDAGTKAIDVGDLFACALDTSGVLRCWGDDTYGELGKNVDGGSTSSPVSVTIPGGERIAAVSTALDPHACALLTSGNVACWGQNRLGSLGHNPSTDPTCPPTNVPCSASPVIVGGVTGATAVRAASGVTCALVGDGGVSCWGDNGLGEFGNGTAENDGGAHFVPQRAAGGRLFVAFDTRYDFTLALDSMGTVWGWGSSSRGALGNGSIAGPNCDNDGSPCVAQPTVIMPPFGNAPVIQISAGDEFGLALESDGTVWAWGANVDGRLGHAPGAGDAGDLMNCGAPVKDEICNPVPSRVVFP